MACEHINNRVIDSRLITEGSSIKRRRRVCRDCGIRWSTYEIPAEQYHAHKYMAAAMKNLDNIPIGKLYKVAKEL